MPDTSNGNNLEAARTRLETALSALAQGAASTRGALDVAATMAEEKAKMAERITALEQENLKLHEQVAAYALQSSSGDDDERIKSLEEEKSALEQNYQLLKNRYAALQDEMEGMQTDGQASPTETQQDTSHLREIITTMEQEKANLKSELDKTIAELESMLESA